MESRLDGHQIVVHWLCQYGGVGIAYLIVITSDESSCGAKLSEEESHVESEVKVLYQLGRCFWARQCVAARQTQALFLACRIDDDQIRLHLMNNHTVFKNMYTVFLSYWYVN